MNNGYKIPSNSQNKKQVPQYTMGNGPQTTLWEDEKKRASNTPGPLCYNPQHKLTQASRFSMIAIGYDSKCNQKQIKLTPGPSDYINNNSNGFNKVTFNHSFNNGGLKPPASATSKHAIVVNTLKQMRGRVKSSQRTNVKLVGSRIKNQAAGNFVTTSANGAYPISDVVSRASGKLKEIGVNQSDEVMTVGAKSLTNFTRNRANNSYIIDKDQSWDVSSGANLKP